MREKQLWLKAIVYRITWEPESEGWGSLLIIRGYHSMLWSLRYITQFNTRRLLSTSCLSPRPTFPFSLHTSTQRDPHTHTHIHTNTRTHTGERWPFLCSMYSVAWVLLPTYLKSKDRLHRHTHTLHPISNWTGDILVHRSEWDKAINRMEDKPCTMPAASQPVYLSMWSVAQTFGRATHSVPTGTVILQNSGKTHQRDIEWI